MKGVIIFLSGVAVGALGTAIWTMKKLVPEMREEAAREARESMREIPDYSMYLTDEEDTEDGGKEEEPASDDIHAPAPAPSEVKKAVQENRETPKVDYSRYSDKKKAERKAPAESTEEQEEPFVITPSEFNIRGGYLAKAYSIYQNNIIVDDDSDEVVDINPLDVFGKTAMEELKKEGVVYIQDDSNKRYYRVEEMECDYEGPDPEDEDDYWRR